jgi:putative transposase
MQFIAAAAEARIPFAALCRLFDVSRKTGYKWLERAADGGALEDISRRPHGNSRAMDEKLAARLVRLRKKYPTWGARKLIGWLDDFEHGRWELPAASTVTELLKRQGLVQERSRRQRLPPRSAPLAHAVAPNDLWCMDFKGDFRMGDGRRCYPLTITDAYSRMLLCVRGQLQPDLVTARRNLERVFRTWGLPRWMRTDNGPPFGTMKTGPLSQLSAWLIKVGVLPEYTDLASPHQNGRHERMHGTLKAETAMPPAGNLEAQQRRFDRFKKIFNLERPHESLDQRPPAWVHSRSQRELPAKVTDPTYAKWYEVRRINAAGCLAWKNARMYFSDALAGELVGITEVDNGLWEVYFGPLVIARLHEAYDELSCKPRRVTLSPMSPV